LPLPGRPEVPCEVDFWNKWCWRICFWKMRSNMRLSHVAETAGCPNFSGNIIG
jgi:hypothetical protein